MKISTDNGRVRIDNGKTSAYAEVPDRKFLVALDRYLSFRKCGSMGFTIQIVSGDRKFIKMADGYRILIDEHTCAAIVGKMWLLNTKPSVPKINVEDSIENDV